MKKADVKVGQVYWAKVSNKTARVKINGPCSYGGWFGVNLSTKRRVRIKSARRLLGPCSVGTY